MTTSPQARIASYMRHTHFFIPSVTSSRPPSKHIPHHACITSLTSTLLPFLSEPCRRVLLRHRRHRLYAVFVFLSCTNGPSCCTCTSPAGLLCIVPRLSFTIDFNFIPLPHPPTPTSTCALFMFVQYFYPNYPHPPCTHALPWLVPRIHLF